MMSRFHNPSVVPSFLLLASLLCIMTLGGCPGQPKAQEPVVPAETGNDPQQQDDTTTPDSGLDRPIVPPDVDTGDGGGGSGGTVDDGGSSGTGGQGGQTGGEFVVLTVDGPDEATAVRPGTAVDVTFTLSDFSGSVETAAVIVARDDDQNGEPDDEDNPVYTEAFVVTPGIDEAALDTQEIADAGLLTNDLGHFVVGIRVTLESGKKKTDYAPGTLTIDGVAPVVTWVGAGPSESALDLEDHLVGRDTDWTVRFTTTDNGAHTVQVVLDQDLNPR